MDTKLKQTEAKFTSKYIPVQITLSAQWAAIIEVNPVPAPNSRTFLDFTISGWAQI